jgi:PAS domain S-box-containing protein
MPFRPARVSILGRVALAARAYACFGLALIALHLGVGGSVLVYELIGASSVAAVVVGIEVYRPEHRLGWWGIALAQGLFWAGDVAYQAQSNPPFPGVGDGLYLVSYVVFIASIVLLLDRDFPWRDWTGHLDAALITACVGFLGWVFVIGRDMHLAFTWAGAVSAAYPLLDLIALGLLIRVGLQPGRRPVSYWLLLLSLLPLLVADGSYVIPSLSAGYHLGSWLDAGWLGAYVLVGLAALHPSMTRLAHSRPGAPRVSPVRSLVAGGIGLVLLRAADRYEGVVRHRTESGVGLAAGLVLVLLVLARLALLVRELDRQRRRAEESERKFRMVFERSPLGISIGRHGVMSETNPALQRMLGYSRDEFARMHYTQVTHPDALDLPEQGELDAGLRDQFSIDKRYVAKDGSPIAAHVHVVLDGEDGLGISLIEDVTERVELEAQLRQSQKMDAIGQLAGGIAHDFNNLMTAVLGYSDLLLARMQRGDPNREKVDGIRDAALRASDLTRQLLAFGRRQMLNVTEVDLREVVERSRSLLERLIGENIRLETVLWPEPVVVRADPTQLDQVVVNLAVNARDAMPQGGRLTIAVRAVGDEGLLSVADTGVGMDAATRERVFEPFFTTKPFGEGSGLGLSTVEGIVAQSGGSIAVTSDVGAGTVFRISLPLVSVLAKVPVD